jgi:hypothetical protein
MIRTFVFAFACAACAAALAAPAPWYWWESKPEGHRVCSQTPLGPGWQRVGPPYKDSHCEKPYVAK